MYRDLPTIYSDRDGDLWIEISAGMLACLESSPGVRGLFILDTFHVAREFGPLSQIFYTVESHNA